MWSRDAGWRRGIGCLKLQVSFCKRATKCTTLSWKETHKDMWKETYKDVSSRNTGWRRGIRCFIFIRLFLQKSPIISGYFAERDVRLKASCAVSSPCNHVLQRLNSSGGDEVVKECKKLLALLQKETCDLRLPMHLRHPVTISATTQRQRRRWGMGWLRLVGSLKLQVSFAEYSLFYRALLQRRPMILRSLVIVATP